MKPIFRATLRTLDVEAAEHFYRNVLGVEPVGVVRLHDQAIARGAKPHWLGFVDVSDVDRAAASFVARGASPLGPKWINPEGLEAAVMRDPGGAVIALAKPPPDEPLTSGPDIVFHSLDTNDVARAMNTYSELFGWHFGERVDLGDLGTFYPFSWEPGSPQAGVFADIKGRPQVHPHWLFHFRVVGLDAAIARVQAGGGSALDPVELPSGDRCTACDDPQGAAFALYEARGAR